MSNTAGTRVDDAMQQCIADAVATWLMGPAYPFAQVLLGLDPFEGFSARANEATADNRVHAMVQMLTLMNKESGPFTNAIDELSKGWDEALGFVNASGSRNVSHQTNISTVVRTLHKDKLAYGGFEISSWENIHELSEKLVESELPEAADESDIARVHRELDDMDLGLPPEPELRHLLNAAWRARVRSPEMAESNRSEHQDAVDVSRPEARDPLPSSGERVQLAGSTFMSRRWTN